MQKAIEASGISKKFGESQALDKITFSVNESEIFGFIGPDGAGKTTLFRIITTLLLPDEGEMTVLGMDSRTEFKELRKNIGYMPGRFSLYQDLSVEEKQKLALSCALIHKPKLIILDEPTTGVDAVSRSEFWEMIRKLRQYNLTIIVSTPYMDEAMKCDRVALIQEGHLLSINQPEKIRKEFSRKLFSVKAPEKYKLINALRSYPGTITAYPFGDSVHVTFREDEFDNSLYEYLTRMGISNVMINETRAGIEDRFLELMEQGKKV